jgi:hypothetical protein
MKVSVTASTFLPHVLREWTTPVSYDTGCRPAFLLPLLLQRFMPPLLLCPLNFILFAPLTSRLNGQTSLLLSSLLLLAQPNAALQRVLLLQGQFPLLPLHLRQLFLNVALHRRHPF